MAGRYNNPIPTRYLAPIDCLKIPAQKVAQNSTLLQGPREYSFVRQTRAVHLKFKKTNHVLVWASKSQVYHLIYYMNKADLIKANIP